MDICSTCFMLLFRLPTVEFLHSGALKRQLLRGFIDALKNLYFSFPLSFLCICWKLLWPSAHPLASPKRNTHSECSRKECNLICQPGGLTVLLEFLSSQEMKSIPPGKVAEHKNIWLAGIPDLTPTVTPQNDFHTQRILKKKVLVGLTDSRTNAAQPVVWDRADWWVYLQYGHRSQDFND